MPAVLPQLRPVWRLKRLIGVTQQLLKPFSVFRQPPPRLGHLVQ